MQAIHTKDEQSVRDMSPEFEPEDIVAFLVEQNRISVEDAERVKQLVFNTEANWGEIFDRLGLLTQKDWLALVAQFLDLPFYNFENAQHSSPINERVSLGFLRSRKVYPLNNGPNKLSLVTADPWDGYTLQAIKLVLNADNLKIYLATSHEIELALNLLEEQREDADGTISFVGNLDDAQYLLEMANEAPTIRAVDSIFSQAFQAKATDIHIEPMPDRGRLRFRVNGVLREGESISQEQYQGVISRIKILCDMDIAERRRPQDGRMNQRFQGRTFDIRAATLPTIHGETIAMRILIHDAGLISLERLNMLPEVKSLMDWGLMQRNGLIIITGPTGSGKTTTLHSALSSLNDIGKKILTAENPVEIRLEGALQVEARKEIELDFKTILKSFLRHDPDILMIGEIRDGETTQVAIQAALTGRLVFSTLHTNSAASAVSRLRDLGTDDYLIANVLRAVFAQRLIRSLCNTCAVSYQSVHGTQLATHIDGTVIEDTSKMRLPVGCNVCGNTGFGGQVPILEGVGKDTIHKILLNKEYEAPTLLSHGKKLTEDGITTSSELVRVLDTSM